MVEADSCHGADADNLVQPDSMYSVLRTSAVLYAQCGALIPDRTGSMAAPDPSPCIVVVLEIHMCSVNKVVLLQRYPGARRTVAAVAGFCRRLFNHPCAYIERVTAQ